MKQKIGLFGGSFNPPHCGHVMIALWALMTGKFDKLVVVPTYTHAFGKELLDFDHRVEMTKAAFGHLNGFVEVSPVESAIGRSITADTVAYLVEAYAALGIEAEYTVLIGSDIVDTLPRWEGIDKLREIADFMVLDRSLYAGGISSTRIRGALVTRDETYLRQAIPGNVLKLILENGWYEKNEA
jgi:nicotinate-nucleotide adenylyltransferase